MNITITPDMIEIVKGWVFTYFAFLFILSLTAKMVINITNTIIRSDEILKDQAKDVPLFTIIRTIAKYELGFFCMAAVIVVSTKVLGIH